MRQVKRMLADEDYLNEIARQRRNIKEFNMIVINASTQQHKKAIWDCTNNENMRVTIIAVTSVTKNIL